jgi:thiamine phosphate synthase YjbQ (UPF0047 family)
MQVKLNHIFLTTQGNTDILDITQKISECIQSSTLMNGLVTIFCPSSTSGVTTIEYEPGVLQDLIKIFNEIVPRALLKASITIPLADGRMTLGTWQQIVFIDFDTRPRKREIIVQIIGE